MPGLEIALQSHYVNHIIKTKAFFNLSLDYSYPQEEISHRLNVSGSNFILTDATYLALNQITEIENDKKLKILNLKSLMNTTTGLNSDLGLRSLDANDPALILFTSGTTGKPKGVVHSLLTLSYQLSDLQKVWEVSSRDEFFLTLPLNHIHGLVTGMMNGLGVGAGITIHSRFDSSAAWTCLNTPRTSFFTAVPTIYSKLLNHALTNKSLPRNLDHLRVMISGSSSLSPQLLTAWTSEIRKEGIVERYGMTETGMISSNSIDGNFKMNSVGKALPSIEIKIEKSSENEAVDYGQVLVRGPGLFKGYLKLNKKSNVHPEASDFTNNNQNDFFNTGDQGYFTNDGNLKLVGRDCEILKVSGYKVGCNEIESVIMDQGSVEECFVIGLPDPHDSSASSQTVAALLVSDNKAIISDLRRFLATRLAYYKIPRKWLVRTGIPRNLIGKPDRKAIIEMFMNQDQGAKIKGVD